jgi:pimeloyl-ACP methyl ester carboxylesterase
MSGRSSNYSPAQAVSVALPNISRLGDDPPKPAVLLLHGYTANALSRHRLAAALSEAYRLVAVD